MKNDVVDSKDEAIDSNEEVIDNKEEVICGEEKNSNGESNNFEEAEVFQEVEPIKKETRTDSYFDGGLIELIGWRLLAFLITGITFGIGAPWGKCMLYSYQMKHTVYNGKRLKFEGTGGDLFVNMFKWVLLTIITFGIYGFFVPVKKTKWVISNIHFEDEEFVRNESFFDGKTIQLIGINILCNILNTISFRLLYPFTVCYKLRWINKHTVINRKKLIFSGRAISLFGKYILWCFLTIITFGIYGLWLPIKMLKWQAKNTRIKVVGDVEKKDKSLLIAIPIAIIAVIIVSLIIPMAVSKISTIDLDGVDDIPELINRIDFATLSSEKQTSRRKSSAGGTASEIEDINYGTESYEVNNPQQVIYEEEEPAVISEPYTNSDETPERGEFPTIQEITGQYGVTVTEISWEYVDEEPEESWDYINFRVENGYLIYNDTYTLEYQPSVGYAFCIGDTVSVEAYFSYQGDTVRVDMAVYDDNVNTRISGTK